MADKPTEDKPSKVADIARLRLLRYNTRGPGAQRQPVTKAVVDKLRDQIAKVPAKKSKRKKKRGKR